MRVEIEVDLPGHIAAEWDIAKVGVPVEGDVVINAAMEAEQFDRRYHDAVPRVIIRRKDNPRDWWPTWIVADRITFAETGVAVLEMKDLTSQSLIHESSSLIDMSWIPEDLKRSGRVIKNPWKGKVNA